MPDDELETSRFDVNTVIETLVVLAVDIGAIVDEIFAIVIDVVAIVADGVGIVGSGDVVVGSVAVEVGDVIIGAVVAGCVLSAGLAQSTCEPLG